MKLYMSRCCNAETWQIVKYPKDHPFSSHKSYNVCTKCKREYHPGTFESLSNGAKYTGFCDSEGYWEIICPGGDICETGEYPKLSEPGQSKVLDLTSLPVVGVSHKGKKGVLLESQLQDFLAHATK